MSSAPAKKKAKRRDWGRAVAFFLCLVFALVGLVPLGLGALSRTERARAWAARETAALLARELGVTARYDVAIDLWPFALALSNVRVESSDGGAPLLEVERLTVKPRAFSLLAGKLDVGDVELLAPKVRAVVRDGKLQNLAIEAPESGSEAPSKNLPFGSIAVTDAHLDLDIDGIHATLDEVDLDVTAELDGAVEIALRAAGGDVLRVHPYPGREAEEDFVDEDRLCELDARVRVDENEIRVRRLALGGVVDFDPDPGTRPSCGLPTSDWRHVEVRMRQVRVGISDRENLAMEGHLYARVPPALAHRFVFLPHASGTLTLDVDLRSEPGRTLPAVTGTLHAETLGIDGKVFGHVIDGQVAIDDDVVSVKQLGVTWADGFVEIAEAKLSPFEPKMPLSVSKVALNNLEFTGLMRDLGVHPHAHVTWGLRSGSLAAFGGTLSPLALEGPLAVSTEAFEVFDRPADDPARRHMMGVAEARVSGDFVVSPNLITFRDVAIETQRSKLLATVKLRLDQYADIFVYAGTHIALEDVSPLASVGIGGVATIAVESHGAFDDPHIEGTIAVNGLRIGGDARGEGRFEVGDLETTRVAFAPLELAFADAVIRKNGSRIFAPAVRLAFDEGADLIIDAAMDTRAAPHLRARDLFEVFHLDEDPRWDAIDASAAGKADIRYVLGGREDHCGDGYLRVVGSLGLSTVDLFGERYDDGNADFTWVWDDQGAGDAGMTVDLRSLMLRKGEGTVLGSGRVRQGGYVEGTGIATALPIARLDALGAAGKMVDGRVSFVATVGGRLRAIEAVADVSMSPLRIGPESLPPSRMRVIMEPSEAAKASPISERCGRRRGPPPDPAKVLADVKSSILRDETSGNFRVTGKLFDGQVTLDDVTMTRQKNAILAGKVDISNLDLGVLANLLPGVAFATSPPRGRLSGALDLRRLPLNRLEGADVEASLRSLEVSYQGSTASVVSTGGPVVLSNDVLDVPALRVSLHAKKGPALDLTLGGKLRSVGSRPELDMNMAVSPIKLADLLTDVASVERAEGTAEARLHVTGPLTSPRYSGSASVRGGRIDLAEQDLTLDDINAEVDVGGGEVRVRKASARIGGGTLSATARMPLRGLEIGAATATLTARGVRVPVSDGVNFTANANLSARFDPRATGENRLPLVEGDVELTSFSYTRPISLNVDLGQLTGRAQRTEVTTYDPAEDVVRFRIALQSPKPLRFQNNLFDMQFGVAQPGIVLSGTNQRYGAEGQLRVLPDSKIRLRNAEFEVREGLVRFDDPERVLPIVDLRATTEYRRYASSSTPDTAGEAAAGGGQSATAGQWRITLLAQGEMQDLAVSFRSDPPLSQEDVILLLTFGTTRAELDRGLASSLGETVGLEALSALTGADKAVKTIVPILDDFSFGTAYSSRSGRIEPVVTVGKRVTDDVRATVTTGLSESREVRSSVEWRLGRRVSVQGSYDNANDATSSTVGNVGADLRFRFELE